MTNKEMQDFIFSLNQKVFLNNLWEYREEFLNPEDKTVINTPQYISGIFLIYVMQGELEKAGQLLDSIKEDNVLKLCLYIVYPCITGNDFFVILNKLSKIEHSFSTITLTAGRPYVLDGVGDFTRLGLFLPRNKDKAMEALKVLYPSGDANCLYEVCLAEYYYQQNKCYDAELLISHAIKNFDSKGDMRLLFVALFQQLMLLIVNNQCPSIKGYFKDMRNRLKREGAQEFWYNMDALEAWISSYVGDYECIRNWMETDAPDEYGDFNMLDLFRYTVKLRCYLIQDNHIALVALVEKLRPLLKKAMRPRALCLLDYILAMSLHSQGKMEEAFDVLERAIKTARHHGYDRTCADEGERMLNLLLDYHKARGGNEYVMYLIQITRKIAILYPYYLKTPYQNNQKFTEIEADILRLLEHGKSKEEIAECYLISVNTVKYHLKKIYSKLGVSSAHHAIWHAKLLGIIK